MPSYFTMQLNFLNDVSNRVALAIGGPTDTPLEDQDAVDFIKEQTIELFRRQLGNYEGEIDAADAREDKRTELGAEPIDEPQP